MVRLVLPLPPSINHAYVRTRQGMAQSDEVKGYKALVYLLCVGLEVPPKLDLTLTAHLWVKSRRHDLDNKVKILQDALADGLHFNDNRITELHLYRHVDRGHSGRVEVEIGWVNGEVAA